MRIESQRNRGLLRMKRKFHSQSRSRLRIQLSNTQSQIRQTVKITLGNLKRIMKMILVIKANRVALHKMILTGPRIISTM